MRKLPKRSLIPEKKITINTDSMIDYKKLCDLADEKYPMTFGGYFDGEITDGNSEARHAYMQGFEDGMKYAVDYIKGRLE